MTNITLKAVWGILLAGTLSNNYALLHFLGTGAVLENQDHNCKQSMLLWTRCDMRYGDCKPDNLAYRRIHP